MNIYPWHQSNWKNLFFDVKRFSHGLILHGPSNSGINDFASIASKKLICTNSKGSESYCGDCQNCSWFDSQSHPDLFAINNSSLEEAKSIVNIDLIRELKVFFELSSHQKNGKKVAVIYDAHQMNLAASNALLKILEEPPNNSIVILTTSNLSNLLPTIKSRSRLESFSKPSYDDAIKFLKNINKEELKSFLQFYNGNPIALINEHVNHPLLMNIIRSLKQGKKFDLSSISKSAGIALINNPDISSVKIPIPDISTQNKIVKKIQDELKIIDSNNLLRKNFIQKTNQTIEKIWSS